MDVQYLMDDEGKALVRQTGGRLELYSRAEKDWVDLPAVYDHFRDGDLHVVTPEQAQAAAQKLGFKLGNAPDKR